MIEKDLPGTDQSEHLLQSFNKQDNPAKIVLHTLDAMHLVHISDILYCRSDNTYTTFYLSDGESIMVSKGINFYEDILIDSGFFKPHQSYLVNMEHVKKVDKTDGGFVILDNAEEIPISTRRKKGLIRLLEKL
jgi:two-component system LytT family response regulator